MNDNPQTIECTLLVGVDKAQPILVGVKDAARMLGIGERTVWKLTKEGAFPTVRIGSRTLWPTRERIASQTFCKRQQ